MRTILFMTSFDVLDWKLLIGVEGPNTWVAFLLVLVMAGGWTVAYIGIVKRAFQDKTIGMPLIAVYGNFAWEFIYSFVYPDPRLLILAGNILWFGVDFLIIISCFKYGRDDFKNPFIKKWFNPMVVLGLVMGFAIMYSFAVQFKDRNPGSHSAFFDNLIMSILFIAMILRRGNVKGQSVYIALGRLFGTFAAAVYIYYFLEVRILTILIVSPCIFLLDFIYTVLVIKKCKEEGIHPWRRF